MTGPRPPRHGFAGPPAWTPDDLIRAFRDALNLPPGPEPFTPPERAAGFGPGVAPPTLGQTGAAFATGMAQNLLDIPPLVLDALRFASLGLENSTGGTKHDVLGDPFPLTDALNTRLRTAAGYDEKSLPFEIAGNLLGPMAVKGIEGVTAWLAPGVRGGAVAIGRTPYHDAFAKALDRAAQAEPARAIGPLAHRPLPVHPIQKLREEMNPVEREVDNAYRGLARIEDERISDPAGEDIVSPEMHQVARDRYTDAVKELHHERLVSALQQPEGATLHPTGEPFKDTGYFVADPALTTPVPLTSPEEISAYLRRPEVQAAIHDGRLIGKWTDPKTGATEINISDHVTHPKRANALGHARGEQAIGHIVDGVYQGDIPVSPPAPGPSLRSESGAVRLPNAPKMRTIEVSHYSPRDDLSVLDPAKSGTGPVPGRERARGIKGVHVFLEDTPGRIEDAFAGKHRYTSTVRAALYDVTADAEGIAANTVGRGADDATFRRALRKAGYTGYTQPELKGSKFKQSAVLLDKTPVRGGSSTLSKIGETLGKVLGDTRGSLFPDRVPGKAASLAEGLTREEAIAFMKTTTSPAQMQRLADGTFRIIPKNPAPQPTVAGDAVTSVKALQETKKPGNVEEPFRGGFRSRVSDVLLFENKWMGKSFTLPDWMDQLSKHPDVPQAELRALYDTVPEYNGDLADLVKGTPRTALKKYTAREADLIFEEHYPAAELHRQVQTHAGQPVTEKSVGREAEYLASTANEETEWQITDNVGLREGNLNRVRTVIDSALGRGAADSFPWEEAFPKDLRKAYTRDELTTFREEDRWPAIEDLLTRVLHEGGAFDDPQQLPLQTEGNRSIRSILTEREKTDIVREMRRAEEYQSRATDLILKEEMVADDFMDEARVRLEEDTGGGGGGATRNDTEYEGHQRVEDDAPYREIIITHTNLGRSGSHFSDRGSVAHARGELHDQGETYLMIEAQSDLGQARHRAGSAAADDPSMSALVDDDRWVQLSVGASLMQAADEGVNTFRWVSGKNRGREAGLPFAAATITYDQEVPKAVKRIFRWLNIPLVEDAGGGFAGVELNVEARKKLLKYGIPALGIGGIVVAKDGSQGRVEVH